MENIKGLDVIRAYRNNKGNWYPMVEHVEKTVSGENEYGEYNIGWNAGMFDENRPFFAEYWAVNCISMITVFVCSRGIEKLSKKEILGRLKETGFYSEREGNVSAQVETFKDSKGNSFFSINIVAGDEDGKYIDGAPVLPFGILKNCGEEK